MRGSTWSPAIISPPAAADHYPPVARFDADRVSIRHADEADGHRAHDRGEAAPALGGFGFDPLLIPAGRAPIGKGFPGRRVAAVGGQHPREQPLAAGHPQRRVEAFAKPAGKADMIGMEMGDDDAGDAPSRQRAAQ
jgi:hypothetical protein